LLADQEQQTRDHQDARRVTDAPLQSSPPPFDSPADGGAALTPAQGERACILGRNQRRHRREVIGAGENVKQTGCEAREECKHHVDYL
jgi:hypothetical protein